MPEGLNGEKLALNPMDAIAVPWYPLTIDDTSLHVDENEPLNALAIFEVEYPVLAEYNMELAVLGNCHQFQPNSSS